ncbi:hypothetical protein GJ496_007069 [Pomphorhynchus laevis]|nr:hypothetical protein GJ496_007069 [Pomphorhynchus laevis]
MQLTQLSETVFKHFVPSTIGREIDSEWRTILSSPSKLGGLGIFDPSVLCNMEYLYSQRICETYNSGLHSDNLNNLQADIIKGIITTRKIEYQNRLSSILDTWSMESKNLIDHACAEGDSAWLSALSLASEKFHLSATEFEDAICCRNNTAEEYVDILTTLKRKLTFAIARGASLCLRSSRIPRPGAESRFTGIRRAQLNADDES